MGFICGLWCFLWLCKDSFWWWDLCADCFSGAVFLWCFSKIDGMYKMRRVHFKVCPWFVQTELMVVFKIYIWASASWLWEVQGFKLHSVPRLEQAHEVWVENDVTCYLYFMEKRGQALFLQVCSHVLSYEHARGIVFNRAVSELWKATNCLNVAIIIDRKKSCFTNWFWCGIMTEQMEGIIQMAKIAPFE